LIGYDESVSQRNTGNTQDVSINYLTRKAKIVLGNFSDDDVEARTYWKSLPRAPLLTMDDIGSGWDFNPEPRELSCWGLERE